MSKRKAYSDTFTGDADRGIRSLLSSRDEDQSAGKLRRTLLKVINNELTPRQKEIIMLYYFRNVDTVAISKMIGVTPQAVSAAMSRARLKMYNILKYYI